MQQDWCCGAVMVLGTCEEAAAVSHKLQASGLLDHVLSVAAPAGSQRRSLLEAACQARGCLSYNLDLEVHYS